MKVKWMFVFLAVLFMANYGVAYADFAETYTLDNVSFTDGGTATGFVTLDYSSPGLQLPATVTAWNVTVSSPSSPSVVFTSSGTGQQAQGAGQQAYVQASPQWINFSDAVPTGTLSYDQSQLFLGVPSSAQSLMYTPQSEPTQLIPTTQIYEPNPAAPVMFIQQINLDTPNVQVTNYESGTGGSLDPATTTPIPPSALLLASGIVGLAAYRKRFKTA